MATSFRSRLRRCADSLGMPSLGTACEAGVLDLFYISLGRVYRLPHYHADAGIVFSCAS
jgi:hypothetical protein